MDLPTGKIIEIPIPNSISLAEQDKIYRAVYATAHRFEATCRRSMDKPVAYVFKLSEEQKERMHAAGQRV